MTQPPRDAAQLSHIDATGAAHMVDITDKSTTERRAIARGHIRMSPATLALVVEGALPKGDVIATARIAGIMAAKRTAELIPLCHPLPLSGLRIEITPDDTLPGLRIEAEVKTTGRTGVEMEALTAVSTTALTLYDMAKAAQKDMEIGGIALVLKEGGKSGPYHAS